MEQQVEPIINRYWARAEFPFQLLPGLRDLSIVGLAYSGFGFPGRSHVLSGTVALELARVDSSSPRSWGARRRPGRRIDPAVRLGGAKAALAVGHAANEADRGFRSDRVGGRLGCGGGLTTTARRDGDTWVLDGQKKWIGNATCADLTVIWARNLKDGQVKGFVVEKNTPGFIT
jgi:glutaryl-CoA dehydrogenase